MPSSPRIAIVGAGLSGLVLARILSRHGLASTVYERDAGPDTQRQGGLLDLHVESGQWALREAGLYEDFRALTQPQAEAMRVLDKAGTVFIDHAPEDTEGLRPEIDRTVLRDLLLRSMPTGTLAWGRKLSTASRSGTGQTELTFADGSTTSADLVVGADGGWSRVRPLLSSAGRSTAGSPTSNSSCATPGDVTQNCVNWSAREAFSPCLTTRTSVVTAAINCTSGRPCGCWRTGLNATASTGRTPPPPGRLC